MIKAVIFDFDGVVLDSAHIKTQAFRDLFKRYPEHLDEIVEYHIQNQGISRFDKFRFIYDEILELTLTKDLEKKLDENFTNLILNGILNADEILGFKEFVEFLDLKKTATFVASGTPQVELEMIINRRSFDHTFREIWGSPNHKTIVIKDILKRYNLRPDEVLFLGDAKSDYVAALESGVTFRAVESNVMQGFWLSRNIQPISDLKECKDEFEYQATGI